VHNSSQHQSFLGFYTQFTTPPAAKFIPANAKNIHIAINKLRAAFPQHFGLYFHNLAGYFRSHIEVTLA
jgi:hypothetical protein